MPRLRNTRLRVAAWLAKKNKPSPEGPDPITEPRRFKLAKRIENRRAFPQIAKMIAPKKSRKMENATIIPKSKVIVLEYAIKKRRQKMQVGIVGKT
ncbi:hypothetical protein KKE06_00825 [Candidatus Micrarchaeota archaeon]|nr:hypothetical protein [Candidatus Micrarchaeota archaeon]MBU1930150.1 hypothetical protein [Candidatus Micrarchaeota archaeon]